MVTTLNPEPQSIAEATIAIGGHNAPPIQKVVTADPSLLEKVATRVEHLEEVLDEAADAAHKEQNMGLLEAFRAYPKAVGWSMLFSTAIVMEGFDLTMINSFYALPAFQQRYGVSDGKGGYLITPAWQAGLSNAVQVGSILGLMINGWACDRFGYKKTIGISLFLIIAFIAITFTAKSITVLLVGELLCGFPWGVFQTLTTAYAAEVCPIPLRPYLTTYVNLCWVMGQFISSGVLKGVSKYSPTDQWAYRIPFALQWMWPVPILIGTFLAPESPWWFVRHGRLDDAKKSLKALGATSAKAYIDVDKRVSQMVHTNEIEKVMHEGVSYFDCFKGTNLRRTEIVCMVWMIQTICGSGFIGYSTTFYEQAGLSVDNAFSLSLGQYALGAVGTISSWWTMNYFGRRTLYLGGLAAMFFALIAVAGTGFKSSSQASWAAGSLVIVYAFLYQFTVGPVCYCLVAEIPSTRLRAKSVVLARSAYNVVGIINNIIFPRMLSPLSWHWGKKAGFFWAGGCLLSAVWTFFRLPEPKGRTYAELDVLFDDRVPARKFATTAVDLFARGGNVKDENYIPPGGGH
ncbi:MFS alpha-glucoside transporter-like protein [Meredithblackwellia eburnea MCA 4105]